MMQGTVQPAPPGACRSVMPLPTDDVDRIVAFYAEHRILERAREFPGCLEAELWLPVDSGDLVVSALWSDRDRYQAWVDYPWRAEIGRELMGLLAGEGSEPTVGATYYVQTHRPE